LSYRQDFATGLCDRAVAAVLPAVRAAMAAGVDPCRRADVWLRADTCVEIDGAARQLCRSAGYSSDTLTNPA
jgi:hypothetical protein